MKPICRTSLAFSLSENCKYSQLNITQVVDKIKKPPYKCSKLTVFGSYKIGSGPVLVIPVDGQKWVCLNSTSQMKPEKCVVYSFGINNEWRFDDDIAQFGCQVYAFDPTMGKENHNRSTKIHFYNLGVSNFTGITTINKKECKVARLEDIRKMLGHEKTVIDYLKVDVEGWEIGMMEDLWTTSPHILRDYVAQVGMEIHLGNSIKTVPLNLEKYVDILYRLECLGFQITHQEPNSLIIGYLPPYGRPLPCCYEVVWVNQKFL